MSDYIIDILGIIGAVLITLLGTTFDNIDLASKIFGIFGGTTLVLLAIIHKLMQISNEKILKRKLQEQIDKEDEVN